MLMILVKKTLTKVMSNETLNLLDSQWFPVNPGTHKHLGVSVSDEQFPPFRQRSPLHGWSTAMEIQSYIISNRASD